MCILVDSTERKPYGFLFKNEQNQFVYCCSQCEDEFIFGIDLEKHTIVHDENKDSEPKFSLSDSFKETTSTSQLEDTKPEIAKLPIVYSAIKTANLETGDDLNEVNISNFDDTGKCSYSSVNESFEPSKRSKSFEKKTKKSETYLCEICSRKFTSLARIKQHMHAGHIKKKKKTRRSLSPTSCTICGKIIRDMKTHLRVFHSDERPFKCSYCNAAFKQKVHRDTHIRGQHTGEKPYLCNQCGRRYYAQSVLRLHINRYHFHLKPHKCDQCGNAYRQLYELKDHINLHHLNIKMYPCKVCERRFGTKKNLHQHMLSHGEKRFQCKFCHQKFATTSGRRGHEIRNHRAI